MNVSAAEYAEHMLTASITSSRRRPTAQDPPLPLPISSDTRSVHSLEIESSSANDEHNNHGQAEDPHASGLGGDLKSAVVGIIKVVVGPAILYLPHGLAGAGYVVALPIIALATALYLHSSSCLLNCWRLEYQRHREEWTESESNRRRLLPPPQSNKTDVADDEERNCNDERKVDGEEAAAAEEGEEEEEDMALIHATDQSYGHTFHTSYPELARKAYGIRGEELVKVGIALMQSGVCLTYLIFVPHNLHRSINSLFGWDCSNELWLGVMLLIQIPMSWIKSVKRLVYTNLLANILIAYGLSVCLGYAIEEATSDGGGGGKENGGGSADSQEPGGPIANFVNHLQDLPPFASHWFLFIGTSVLLFEGSITLLIPLQEAVQSPEDRAYFPIMYPRTIFSVVVFFVIFGVTCWAAFGSDVNVVLTTSLPDGWLATSVQLAYSIAVIFTFPLQNFPSLEIICSSVAKNLSLAFGTTRLSVLWTNRDFVAGIVVCLLGIIGYTTMNALDKVVSLLGAACGIPIAFVVPPLIENRINREMTPIKRRINYVVAAVGTGAMIIASTTTIMQWRN